jgi:hypothetical protein
MVAAISPLQTLRGPDGCVHFSDLKQFARSPAHYKHAITATRETTRAMRVGTLVDRLLLGGEMPPIWSGDRRGKEWSAFAAKHAFAEICTQAELDDAEQISHAVRANPLAIEYLTGRPQVALTWEMMGVRCATRGVDCVGAGWISDLKVTQTTQPDRYQWHARRMLWNAQLAFYREACRQNGIDTSKGLFLVGVEASPPYPSTVLRLTPRAIEEGEKCVHLWLEQLRACEASGEWPGYVQSVVDFDVEQNVELVGLSEGDDA